MNYVRTLENEGLKSYNVFKFENSSCFHDQSQTAIEDLKNYAENLHFLNFGGN